MIRKKTVLVLGAGASMDYGYPSGADLRRQILAELHGSNSVLERTLIASKCESDEISAFREALYKAGGQSVDQLLEHRPSLIPVGKVAIAGALLKFERLERIWADGWYQYLFAQMNSSFDDFGRNALSIVTFNYDRSLEEFFHQSVVYKYGKSLDEAAKAVCKIPIIHFYGSLGPLIWQPGNGHPYGSVALPGDIRSVSNSIKIIHEGTALADIADQSREMASQKLAEAERIVFVGFGYHETNMNRLLGGVRITARCYGSFVGLYSIERKRIQSQFGYLTKNDRPSELLLYGDGESKDALEFLRREVPLD